MLVHEVGDVVARGRSEQDQAFVDDAGNVGIGAGRVHGGFR